MILYLNSVKNEGQQIEVKLIKAGKEVFSQTINARGQQAEKLIPAVMKALKYSQVNMPAIKQIKVENSGGSFTALRIGVTTANALAYALGIEVKGTLPGKKIKTLFSIVEPLYHCDPNITFSANKL
ncbi:MAG: hypothetical protein NTW06_01820 [Candidatus Falkowbacteria bacterium]|nr:hypothetical protein [Candidatus Falkowbacteria bacterium]